MKKQKTENLSNENLRVRTLEISEATVKQRYDIRTFALSKLMAAGFDIQKPYQQKTENGMIIFRQEF